MARTVDNHSTLEDFRRNYNDLANDVGDRSGLRTEKQGTIVDAINSIEDKSFFFQEFIYTAGTHGTTLSRYEGNDAFGNSLSFKPNRIQVFKNTQHLIEGDDYSIGPVSNGLADRIDLVSAATSGDKITVYAFTGSYLGVVGDGATSTYFTETALNTIYNNNDNGIILNGDGADKTVALETGYTIQFAGRVYGEDDLTLASGTTFTFDTATNGTLTLDGGTITGATSITSTAFVGNVTGQVSDITNHSVNSLTDINTTGATNGQLLIYNSSTGDWEADDAPANYTDEQARDAAAAMINHSDHSNITVVYDDANDKITLSAAAQYGDSDVDAHLSGSNGVSYSSGSISLDYETTSTAPTGVGSTATGHLWFVI